MAAATRVLGLGNDILADDAFGLVVAREIEKLFPPEQVDVVRSSASGFHLLDFVVDVTRLIVVDTVQTGHAAPGTIYVVGEADMPGASADTPHCTGLFDTLALARKLGMPAASEVIIIAVEPADCLTVGGTMHPDVEAALPRVIELVKERLAGTLSSCP
jgi:hydrogenase maturation protease